MAANIPPTEQDYELLSAYVDNQLHAAERAQLEARLSAESALRAELDALRQTVTVLKAAPNIVLPRNFTLDVARYRRPTPWWARYQTMQLIGAVGTFASILLIAAGSVLFTANGALPAAPSAAKSSGALSNSVAVVATATTSPQPTQTALNKSFLPTTTFVIPTLVPTQVADKDEEASATAAAGKFFAQSASGAAAPQPGQKPPSATQQQVPNTPQSPASALAAQAQDNMRDAATATPLNENQAYNSATEKVNADTVIAAPTITPTASETAVAIAATFVAPPPIVPAPVTPVAAPPVILIVGIALLVFSIMLFGIGWLRSRLRG